MGKTANNESGKLHEISKTFSRSISVMQNPTSLISQPQTNSTDQPKKSDDVRKHEGAQLTATSTPNRDVQVLWSLWLIPMPPLCGLWTVDCGLTYCCNVDFVRLCGTRDTLRRTEPPLAPLLR